MFEMTSACKYHYNFICIANLPAISNASPTTKGLNEKRTPHDVLNQMLLLFATNGIFSKLVVII